MNARSTQPHTYYFATRDLLLMAVLAGLGGVASTAINALGDAVQALVGFAGTTQWAAGLHVTLLVLVVGLVHKSGAATLTALLKGGVEVLSGNTHGIIVLLVDLAAGVLIDAVFLALRRREALATYLLAGALGAASNVFVFQLFVSAPEDVIAFVWGIAALAALSGAVLGGLLAHTLLGILRRNGLAPAAAPLATLGAWRQPAFLGFFLVAAALAGGLYLKSTLAGPPSVEIAGGVAAPYAYAASEQDLPVVERTLSLQGMTRRASGALLRDVLALAEPDPGYGAVLVTATDGYSFFIGRDEVETNDDSSSPSAGRGPRRPTRSPARGTPKPGCATSGRSASWQRPSSRCAAWSASPFPTTPTSGSSRWTTPPWTSVRGPSSIKAWPWPISWRAGSRRMRRARCSA